MKLLGLLLHQLVDSYDAGNSNISEEEEIEILNQLVYLKDKIEQKQDITYTTEQASIYLNVTRQTLNNYVKQKLLHPKKQLGGVLQYSKFELDNLKHNGLRK